MNDKPDLLLIHGFPLDSLLWRPQVVGLAAAARVLAPDLRGFGDDRRDVPEVLSMEDFAQDLKDLLDERGIERTVLCGLSMGGYIALAFLERWPERVKGLVLCCTRAGADDDQGRQARQAAAADAHDKGMAVIARAMVPKMLSATTRQNRPAIAGTIEAMIARQRPDAVAAASLGMGHRPDRTALLQRVRVPSLVIAGGDDALIPRSATTAMAAALPENRLVVVPNAGHLVNIEAPDAFNAVMEAFLATLLAPVA